MFSAVNIMGLSFLWFVKCLFYPFPVRPLLARKMARLLKKFVFSLEMVIFKLKICIFSLEICIFRLEI